MKDNILQQKWVRTHHEESTITVHDNGIKLNYPGNNKSLPTGIKCKVADLLKLPIPIYFLNLAGQGEFFNNEAAELVGLNSISDGLGRSIADFATRETAEYALDQTREVIISAQTKLFDEEIIRKDGAILQSLAVKLPWYSQDNQIIGIAGCSIEIGKHSLAQSLASLSQIGFLNLPGYVPQENSTVEKSIHLSTREKQCLKLYAQGYTAKKIGKILSLSHRTIENYINNIKTKLDVFNKADLLRIAMNNFD